jgi:anti-sigma B factor antagonist
MARLRPDPAELVMEAGRVIARRETVVVLPGVIDACNATRVTEQLTLAVSRGSAVIIDMSATTLCDCAGVRAVVLAYQRAAESGAELRLVVTAALVRRIFEVTGVDRLLDLYPSVEAARASCPVTRSMT